MYAFVMHHVNETKCRRKWIWYLWIFVIFYCLDLFFISLEPLFFLSPILICLRVNHLNSVDEGRSDQFEAKRTIFFSNKLINYLGFHSIIVICQQNSQTCWTKCLYSRQMNKARIRSDWSVKTLLSIKIQSSYRCLGSPFRHK